MKAHKKDAVMRAWRKLSRIREIEVLGNQKPGLALRCFPNFAVRMPKEPLIVKSMNVVSTFFERGC